MSLLVSGGISGAPGGSAGAPPPPPPQHKPPIPPPAGSAAPVAATQSEMSAFKAVGSQLAVTAGGIKPASSPLTRSPVTGRRQERERDSEEDTVSPGPSSEGSRPTSPTLQAPGPDAFSWPTHCNYDENRQLLGTEEESSDRQSSDEDEEANNIWVITKEQLNYYVTQFRTMQSNPHGVIPGTQAKEFFEKSRLPIQELRQIWQLSDVTKDGCLSLEEFLTAMHLVVLRRNDIPLPDQLPICLRPSNLRHSVIDRHNKDLYAGGKAQEPLLQEERLPEDVGTEKEKGTTSDLSPESHISSPGRPRPLEFDFNAASVATDPSIACPKPLRLSPDSPLLHTSEESRDGSPQPVKLKREVEYEQLWNVEARRSSSSSSASSKSGDDDVDGGSEEALATSQSSSQGPVSLPYFGVEPRPGNVLGLGRKEGLPPSPPPRPGKTHNRSASLDLNKLSTKQSLPSIPPRASPYHKTSDTTGDDNDARDTKELSASIHRYKESIALLSRTVQELSQEVNDTVEERVVLEYQLDQLKSIGTSDLSD